MTEKKAPTAPAADTTTGDMRTDPLTEAQDARPGSAETIAASIEAQDAERAERMKPAKIGAEDAQAFEASGALVESGALDEIDVKHPAVDSNPRANTTVRQNQIDFNDPTLSDRQAVAQRLEAQGSK